MASTTFEFTANLNNCTTVAQASSTINMNSVTSAAGIKANKTATISNCEFNSSSTASYSKDIVAQINNKVS